MCGIVCYVGQRDAAPILIEGLARLEYRGYDSAGVTIQNGSGVVTRKLRGLRLPRSALWVLAFYAALAAITALWWHWDAVGLPRLLMGTLLLCVALLGIGREVVWIHPVWIVLLPAAIVVAAFFYYPLAPTAVVLALVFIVNVMWFE